MIASIVNGTLVYGVDYSKRGCVTINIENQEQQNSIANATEYSVLVENIDLKQGKIIGNITNNGKKKIYHLPNDKDYQIIDYDIKRGDLLFDTEQDAIDAGFKKA